MLKSIFLFLLCLNLVPESPAQTQLTGLSHQAKNRDFGDPSAPEFSSKGVRVLTTGGFELRWKSAEDFFTGGPNRMRRLKFRKPHCRRDCEYLGEDIWDPSIREGVLYGAVTNDPSESGNWKRRVYAHRFINKAWVRESEPLIEPLPANFTWLGHSYGHHFLEVSGKTYVFYEKVTEERDGLPWKTELFAKRLLNPFQTTGSEIEVFRIRRDYPRTRRSFGGILAEGPRPFEWKGRFYVFFSGGDYASDDYGIHLLRAQNPLGPYTPDLTENDQDLFDYGATMERKFKLTWGAARAVAFEYEGKLYCLFHGIRDFGVPIKPHRDVFLAQLFIKGSKVEIKELVENTIEP